MHLDMDAFYASVEQADHPEWRGKPLVVGGTERGVVSAASYEARRFGVRSAMPMVVAQRLCPHVIVAPVRMRRYQEISRRILSILRDLSPLVEPASIDEAYVDLTGTERLFGPPLELAKDVKQQIRSATSLICSIGIAPNKFLAKIASDKDKPNGLFVLEPRKVESFLRGLPVGRLPGVGGKTEELLHKFGVMQVRDLMRFPTEFWEEKLGKVGLMLCQRALGVDPSPVVPFETPKSCGAEDTLARDTLDRGELRRWLLEQSERVGRDLRLMGMQGRTVTVKIKFADFTAKTHALTMDRGTDSSRLIHQVACHLLDEIVLPLNVRLIGVAVSSLSAGDPQLRLFQEPAEQRQRVLEKALDEIRARFGSGAVHPTSLLGHRR
jgi:DNA polymerase-4